MKDEKIPENVRIDLTAEQKEHVKRVTGRYAEAIELTAEELEERIAPGVRLQNHNETLLG